mgnify:CR=1 FL=1
MTDINIINRRLEISDELIESLLITAFEGGSTYWAENVSCKDREDMLKVGGYKSQYLTRTKKKDAVMYIHDGYTEEKHAITKKSIIDALQKMDDPKYKHTKALDRILNQTYDAWDADCMLQMACFGEVVYG